MDPLVVAGRLGELIDPLLRDLHPAADPDLGADGRLDLIEVLEDPHVLAPP